MIGMEWNNAGGWPWESLQKRLLISQAQANVGRMAARMQLPGRTSGWRSGHDLHSSNHGGTSVMKEWRPAQLKISPLTSSGMERISSLEGLCYVEVGTSHQS